MTLVGYKQPRYASSDVDLLNDGNKAQAESFEHIEVDTIDENGTLPLQDEEDDRFPGHHGKLVL